MKQIKKNILNDNNHKFKNNIFVVHSLDNDTTLAAECLNSVGHIPNHVLFIFVSRDQVTNVFELSYCIRFQFTKTN